MPIKPEVDPVNPDATNRAPYPSVSFTVTIGSIARPGLIRSIDSFLSQDRVPEDQMIIVADSYADPESKVVRSIQLIVDSFGVEAKKCIDVYEYDAGYHYYSAEQANWAWANVPMRGTHILSEGDDDIYTPGAFAKLRTVCAHNPRRPVIFRFVAPWRMILWDAPRMLRSHVSGQCMAVPRHLIIPFSVEQRVDVDYDWMLEIIENSGMKPLWMDEILSVARPDTGTDQWMNNNFGRGARR